MIYFKDEKETQKTDGVEIPFTGKDKALKKTVTKIAKCYKPKNEK